MITLLRRLLLTVVILIVHTGHAQLTSFTLSLTKTDETCTGNGTIQFLPVNATPGSSIVFAVYLLPDTTAPVATTSATFIDGLSAGQYRVIATQTLNGQTNSAQQDIGIFNLVVPLTYYLSGGSVCSNGSISVAVNQGTAVSYEIISGPVTVPPQPSPVFQNLPVGQYAIRVHDACGDAVVQTFTLVNPPQTFHLDALQPKGCALADCQSIRVAHELTALTGQISYPVSIRYVVHTPSGVQEIWQTVANGAPDSQEFETTIPYFNGQMCTVDVTVTDQCGYVTTTTGNVIDEAFSASVSSSPQCTPNFAIEACNYVLPVTVSFVSAPPGFDPLAFNAAFPGPFAELPIIFAPTGTALMPQGNYTVQVTDSCGRTAQATILIGDPPEPGYSMLPQNCGFGQVSMPGQNGVRVAQVVITGAPASFSQGVPFDASPYIQGGFFQMSQLPAGAYTFEVVSVCGQTYEYDIVIPSSGAQPVLIGYLRGCGPDTTSVRIGVQNSQVTQIIFNAAPVGFPQVLPYDASAQINPADGTFYMSGLPAGAYTLFIKDDCGQRTITVNMPGYAILSQSVDVEQNCGSFNILINYASNEPFAQHTFWLQKYDPATGAWMHPITGVSATANAEPTLLTAYALLNQIPNLNISAVGTFRVVKLHKVYGDGQNTLTACVVPIKEFIFTGGPQIVAANILPCVSNPGQVAISAIGMAPLSYFITAKDGQPFYVSNGSSNVFTGLTPGVYNFQVRDVCQNIVNRLFDFGSIPPPLVTQGFLCDGQPGQLSVQGFDFLNFQWWNTANPGVILSTSSALSFAPFSAAVHSGTYTVRIYSTDPGFCTDQTISYTIAAPGTPISAGDDTKVDLCGTNGAVSLFDYLDGTYQAGGTWHEITSSGMLTGHTWLPEGIPYGTYRFRYTVEGLCGASDSAEVAFHFNPVPETPVAGSNTPVCASDTIVLTVDTIAGATYQWTGPDHFASDLQNPEIPNASAGHSGVYWVTAKIGECVSAAAAVEVIVNPSPDFEVVAGCTGNAYTLTAAFGAGTLDGGTVEWSGPDGFFASGNTVDVSGGARGMYTVTVTANGCARSRQVAVSSTQCAVPAGISPNADDTNERFDLTGFDVLTFKIYNRYGRMVFEQDDYTNQWFGQDFNGNLLPDATYYYYIRQKTGVERTGWVYVTR